MEKKVDELVAREYPILLHRDKEGDYIAEIPDLPGCMTDAKSKEEALGQIEDAKRTWITLALEKGVDVPSPRMLDEEPSGKLLLRLPKSLHRSLRWEAEREGVSMNQSVVFLLTKAIGIRSTERVREEMAGAIGTTIFIRYDPAPLTAKHWSADPVCLSVHERGTTYGFGLGELRASPPKGLAAQWYESEEKADLETTLDQLVRSSRSAEARGSGGSR